MKVDIVYESKHGNGKKCVDYLAELLRDRGEEVEILSIRDIDPTSLSGADLYVFSAPTHVGKPSRKMRKFLKGLDVDPLRYALMTTHAREETRALQFMEDILSAKGGEKVAEGLKIKVYAIRGPLEDDYRGRLEEFADSLT
ncbi:MAG: flavodoxin family protein [Methanomassiliicoccales archaeon]